MATLKSVIEYVDSVKPNAFTNAVKTAWVNECEGLVQTEVLLRAIDEVEEYTWAEDQDTELLVRPPHDKLYRAYLTAMVDFANGEYNRYANTMEMFNAHFGEFQRWFAHVYRPADTHGDVYADAGTLIDTEWRGYYITAYGIAVKHGYQGTEAEWLEMLYGRAEEAAERAEEAADGLEEFVEQAREELSADRTVTWNPAMVLDSNAGVPEEMTLSFTPAAGSAPTIANPTTLQTSWDGLRIAIDETVTGDASVGTFIGFPEGTSGGTVDLVSKTVTRDAWVVVRLEVENDVIVARTTGTAGSYGYDTTNNRILITNMAPQAIAANAESTLCSHSTSVKTKHNQVSAGQDGDYCAAGETITYKFADGKTDAEAFIRAQYNAGHPLAFAYLRSEGTEAEPLEMEDVTLHKGTNRVEAVVTQTGSGTAGEQIPRSHGQMRLTYNRNLGLEHLETAYGVDTTITTFDEVWTNQQTGNIQGATVYLVEVPKRNRDGSYNHVFLQCAAITRDSSGNPISATPKKPSEWAEELNAPIVMNAGFADYNSGSGRQLRLLPDEETQRGQVHDGRRGADVRGIRPDHQRRGAGAAETAGRVFRRPGAAEHPGIRGGPVRDPDHQRTAWSGRG